MSRSDKTQAEPEVKAPRASASRLGPRRESFIFVWNGLVARAAPARAAGRRERELRDQAKTNVGRVDLRVSSDADLPQDRHQHAAEAMEGLLRLPDVDHREAHSGPARRRARADPEPASLRGT